MSYEEFEIHQIHHMEWKQKLCYEESVKTGKMVKCSVISDLAGSSLLATRSSEFKNTVQMFSTIQQEYYPGTGALRNDGSA